MKREIEFRGIDKNGLMHVGSLVTTNLFIKKMPMCHTKHWIVTMAFGNGGWFNVTHRFHVKTETVGQFTGLFDCNGTKIFEGDIVRDHVGVGEVMYSDKKASFKVNYHDGFAKWFIDYNLRGERESIEVIGNIHQNPELLS